jgi:hypothetical protein
MKTIWLIVLFFWTTINLNAQNQKIMENNKQDQAAITHALENLYFKGIHEGNLDLLKQVFHPGTLLFGDVKGQPYAKTLDQYLDGVAHRQSPKDSGKPYEPIIISVRVVNSIAVAEVRIRMYDFHYHDILSFHKLDGEWRIVSKLMSDINL